MAQRRRLRKLFKAMESDRLDDEAELEGEELESWIWDDSSVSFFLFVHVAVNYVKAVPQGTALERVYGLSDALKMRRPV